MHALPSSRPARHPARPGFTLTEILVVIAVLALLMAIAVPAIGGYPKSRQITAEADNLTSQIAYARLIAVSSGRPVEIRFYQEAVIPSRPDSLEFRSRQVMLTDEQERMRPDGRITRFSGKVILSKNQEYSSILQGELKGPDPRAAELGNRAVQNLRYKSLRFLPDGSTNLGKSGGYWTLTFLNWSPKKNQNDLLPANFVTLKIDPFNGKVRRYEPGY